MDADSSGTVSIEELREVFDNRKDKKDSGLWNDLMKEVDQDGDNEFCIEEFMTAMETLTKIEHH